MKTRLAACLLLLSSIAPLRGADSRAEPFWLTLERGKLAFREGAYGDALMTFEDARRAREAFFGRMSSDLVLLLSNPEVRPFEDDLALVERYIGERRQDAAKAALEQLYYRVPRAELHNSAARALEELQRLKAYPEAEFWIGETYREEGELEIALKQYQMAYQQRDQLEAPGFATEILYRIAEVRRLRKEYGDMEEALEEILRQDTLWREDKNAFMRTAMARTLEKEGIDRFLTLYRYDNTTVLKAHQMLGFFYYDSGRYNRAAEHLLFAFLIESSVLAEAVIRDEFDFRFTTLEALLDKALSRPDLAPFLTEWDYYRTFYYLGASYYGMGQPALAQNCWRVIARRADAGEWQTRARQLR